MAVKDCAVYLVSQKETARSTSASMNYYRYYLSVKLGLVQRSKKVKVFAMFRSQDSKRLSRSLVKGKERNRLSMSWDGAAECAMERTAQMWAFATADQI